MQCPACGTLNGRADRMCRMCGGALPEQPKPTPSESAPSPEPADAGATAGPTASPSTVTYRARTSPPRCPSCFAVNVYSAVFCRSCGARLPEEPVYADASAAPAAAWDGEARNGPAWEHATGLLDLGALFSTMRDALLAPNVTFSNMRREGGGTRPLTYVLVMHLVFLPVYIGMFWFAGRELRTMAHQWGQMSQMGLPSASTPGATQAQGEAFVELMRQAQDGTISQDELERRMQALAVTSPDPASPSAEPGTAPAAGVTPDQFVGAGIARMVETMLGPAGLLIGVPLMLLFGALMSLGLGTLMIHLSLKLVGGARSIETTFRALCYASGSAAPLQLVPLVGTSLGTIWALVINVLAQARAHEISAWRVLGGYVLTIGILVCGTCAIAIL